MANMLPNRSPNRSPDRQGIEGESRGSASFQARTADIIASESAAVRLMLLAVGGFVASVGLAMLGWVVSNIFTALLLGGLMMVLTAILLITASNRLGQQRPASREASDIAEGLLMAAGGAVFVTDKSGRILASSRPFQDMLGTVPDELTGLVAGHKATSLLGAMQAVRATGQASVTIEPRALSGPAEISGQQIADMILWRIEALANPLSEAIEALRAGLWLQPVAAELGLGFLVEDPDGAVHYLSPIVRQWLDLDEEEAVPDDVRLDGLSGLLRAADEVKVEVDAIGFPLLAPMITGGEGLVDSDSADQFEAEPATAGRLVLVQSRSAMRDMGRTSSGLVDPLLDTAPIVIAVVDKEGRLKDYNRPIRRYMGGEDLAVGMDVKVIAAPDERRELGRMIELAQAGNPSTRALDIHFAQTAERVGQVSFSSLVIDDERFAVLFIVDRTQEKSLERQFVQAQKMQAVGQLAGGVAHDFNNLLTAIIGYCDLLLSRHDVGDQSFSDLMQIKQNANRAANLVRQLLAFSRQQTLRPKVLWLVDVLSELSNLLRRLIGENIELKIRHGRDLQPVRVDQGQLDQVIINLAVNARDAMDDGGVLEIQTSMVEKDDPYFERFSILERRDYVLIEIVDTGSGIEEEHLSKIFEPFFTTKEVGRGTGLGLSTVYGIVKQTGGYVFVESKVGEGTRFLLFFPAHHFDGNQEPQEAERKDKARDLSGQGTILLVEDEDPVRMLAIRALKLRGYDVHAAASGEGALEVIEQIDGKLDLMISDVVMPNMDGPALLQEVRKTHPDLPVIFISGYAEDVVRKSLEARDVQFLQKPFELKELAEKVKSVLEPEDEADVDEG